MIRHTAALLTAALLLFGAACDKNPAVAAGKQVKINYTLTVDGKVVDTSAGKPPLAYVQGSGQIIPGLEEALVGLQAGAKKQVTVAPEKGYGALNPDAKKKYPRSTFKNLPDMKVGMMVNGQAGGRPVQAKVMAITAKEVILDFNHPLAGKTLNFDVEVMEVSKPSKADAAAPLPPVASAPAAGS